MLSHLRNFVVAIVVSFFGSYAFLILHYYKGFLNPLNDSIRFFAFLFAGILVVFEVIRFSRVINLRLLAHRLLLGIISGFVLNIVISFWTIGYEWCSDSFIFLIKPAFAYSVTASVCFGWPLRVGQNGPAVWQFIIGLSLVNLIFWATISWVIIEFITLKLWFKK